MNSGGALYSIRCVLRLATDEVEKRSRLIASNNHNGLFLITATQLADIENDQVVPTLYMLSSLSVIYKMHLCSLCELYPIIHGCSKPNTTMLDIHRQLYVNTCDKLQNRSWESVLSTKCGESFEAPSQTSKSSLDPRIYVVLGAIDANPGNVMQMASLAAKVNLSISRLSHLFKSYMGISLSDYVRNRRLEYARRLLDSTFLSVKEISTNVGFNNESHFVRMFRRSFGVTPLKYRKASASHSGQ